ncbi:MAG: alpha/beta hydrolase [Actinobacteria bacterium]|nr:alpha/beta hydrolase [Actinomycetota bacterium]
MRLLRWVFGSGLVWRLFGPTLKPRFKTPQEHPWRLPGRTVFVGDEEFLVREAGPEDGDPILLIHGLGGSSLGEWYQIGPKLATYRRVIMVDHRNHGMAPQASQRYEVEDVADDVAAVLDDLGIGAIDVVGYSMGGAIAQALAYRHPGRVSSLVLIATFASHPDEMKWIRQAGAILTRAWERFAGVGTPEVRTGYLLAAGAVERRHSRWLWEETHRRIPDTGAQATLAVLRFNSRRWIGRLGVKTMVIISTDDLLVPPAWQYELASLIPEVRVVEIVGARHEVVWSHPDRILDELNSFLG